MDERLKTRRMRLPDRLTKPSEFLRITKKGARYRQNFLTVYIARALETGAGGGSGRVGFIITGHAVKGSAKRNRIRRLLREAVRKWWGLIKPGFDIVLKAGASPNIDHADYVERTFITGCLAAGILTEQGTVEAEGFLNREAGSK